MMYTHRNGETIPPTETGRYWFKGLVRSMEYNAITSVINDDEYAGYLAAWYEFCGDGWFESTKAFNGQWWGPVLAPWEELQP